MKYFSLSEALIAAPAAFLLGIIFALVVAFVLSVLCGVKELLALLIKNVKIKRNKAADSKKSRILNNAHFIVSEFFNFILTVAFGIVFTVFVYIASDGIVRVYIPLLVLLGFCLFSNFCRRPLDKVCCFISRCVYKILFGTVFAITYFPLKIYKKASKKLGN